MAAALVEVDEVRVEATLGKPDGVKVRPEVSKTTNKFEQFEQQTEIGASRCDINLHLMHCCKVRITDPFNGPHTPSQRVGVSELVKRLLVLVRTCFSLTKCYFLSLSANKILIILFK